MKNIYLALLCVGSINIAFAQNSYPVNAGDGNGLKFWNGIDAYKIHMGGSSEYHFGPVTDYSIKTNMDNYTNGRGFTWGREGATPIAAISILGHMQIAGSFMTGGILGVGTASPDGLQINAALSQESSRNVNNVRIGIMGGTPRIIFDANGFTPVEIDNYNGQFRLFSPGVVKLVVNSNGNVGIGTGSPDQLLTVNGTIHSKEVKVDLSVPGPDYVFADSYDLPSLENVESYIDQNKHLPEVPSAAEMEKNGINVGEMNMLLLKKVEELTLYVIEMKKEIEILKKK